MPGGVDELVRRGFGKKDRIDLERVQKLAKLEERFTFGDLEASMLQKRNTATGIDPVMDDAGCAHETLSRRSVRFSRPRPVQRKDSSAIGLDGAWGRARSNLLQERGA